MNQSVKEQNKRLNLVFVFPQGTGVHFFQENFGMHVNTV